MRGYRYKQVRSSEVYFVDEDGNIGRPLIGMKPSGQWTIRGLVRFNNFGHEVEFVAFPLCMSIPRDKLRHKNGKGRFFIADTDHGSNRTQMQALEWVAAIEE